MQKWTDQEPNKTVSSILLSILYLERRGAVPPIQQGCFLDDLNECYRQLIGWKGLHCILTLHIIIQGFSLAHNTDKSVFEYMEAHPDKAKRFAGAMSSFASYRGHRPEFLARGYPWASLGNKAVVDVGGSDGNYSIALAQSFPQLKFIVQDLPAVVTAVNSKRPVPVGLEDRVTFMEHDMFTEQPVSADVYMFGFVFHDLPDKYVARILR